MGRNFYLSFIAIISLSASALAQSGAGTLKGVIKDSKTGELIPFANVVVESGGSQVGSGQSNINGEYIVKPLDPGSYEVKTSYVGYKPIKTTGVIVSAGKITTVDVKLESSIVEIKTFEVVEYDVPLIDDYQGKTITKEEIYALPTRNIQSVAATTAGVIQADEGDAVNMRGSRDDATFYFIDGIKVRGSTNIPQQGIEQIQIITGGVPAMYGDLTGGVISITTRGPSQTYNGGLELVRSVDGFGYSLLGFNLTGPIATRKLADGTKKPFIGFFLATELNREADRDPSAIGNISVRKDRLDEISANPLRVGPLGIGSVQNARYIKATDFDTTRKKQNFESNRVSISGKIDFKLNDASTFTIGGTWDYFNRMEYALRRNMFNTDNNIRRIDDTYRVYAKFTQRIGSSNVDENSASNIKNVFYNIQADFSRTNIKRESDLHQDRLFDYGYIGKFKTYKEPFYGFGIDSLNGIPYFGLKLGGFRDTLFTFERAEINPLLANYTSDHYGLANGVREGYFTNLVDVIQGGGLLNGGTAPSIYALYDAPGNVADFTQKVQNDQIRLVGNLSLDIKGHEIGIGFEYEQRTDRGYTAQNLSGLWTQMRLLANRHIEELDLLNPMPQLNPNGSFSDTILYNRLYNGSSESFFSKNLRKQLGLAATGTDWIDVDNLSPETFNLNMFSVDELFNGGSGNTFVSYNGYDYLGNKTKGRKSLDNFLNAKDENGNFKREIGAYTPIYMSAYIQDKFAFRDLIFNVGLRVDRFDANQSVLADPFSLQETRKAREFNYSGNNVRPENIGDDYVVYVKDKKNTSLSDASNIAGYRNGNRWYNASGQEVADPNVIAQANSEGRATPALLNPNNAEPFSAGAFRDYKPQVNLMPRIAFQFPISDVSQFFAHYDVLTQRPTERNRLDPLDYFFLANSIGNIVNNPDLKPQRTIDYEVGFKQALSQSSALTISAFYREMRNLIQVIPVNFAWPVTYTTMGNIDFGTVKGLSLAYDLRRTGNVRLTANYTLQFADGTGSSSTGAFNLLQSGQPNLRTTIPLSFDTRHQIQTTFDYRYGEGKYYNGPRIKGKNILQNTGLNLVMIANSGTPYSASSVFTQDGSFGNAGRPQLKGSLNGSRLPFQFRLNARLDRSFTLKYGKKKEGDERKTADLQVYVLVQNLLDNLNIINVYRATGNPDDDGYLTALTSLQNIQQQLDPVSFAQLYAAKINNPDNFARPRIIRIGAILNF